MALLLCKACNVLLGQNEDKLPPAPVPVLHASARTLEEFTPPQWTVLSKAAGDLNGDDRPDLAFVMRGTNKALVLPKSETHSNEQNTNPFIFGVALAEAGGGYRLLAQNNIFLPRQQEAEGDDEFGEGGTLEIKRGVLSIEFGAMQMSANILQKYVFRYQHNRMELIGFENEEIQRAIQRDTKWTVNYSTGVEVVTETMPDEKDKVQHRALHNKPPLSLEKLGSADDFSYFEL